MFLGKFHKPADGICCLLPVAGNPLPAKNGHAPSAMNLPPDIAHSTQ
jgi:hypothetical protein